MKRTILAVMLILFAGFSVYGQNTSPIDLVLLLDTSAGMSSSYDNVNNYITGPFLSEFLRVGDTFHLIAFSGSPRLDVARRINDVGDVETIIGRMFIQYPVESGSNIGAAITYAERYIGSLPVRPKKIVLVSTGGSDTSGLVIAARQRLGSNATIDFVQVIPGQPLSSLPRSERPPAVTGTGNAVTQPAVTQPSGGQTGVQPGGQSGSQLGVQPGQPSQPGQPTTPVTTPRAVEQPPVVRTPTPAETPPPSRGTADPARTDTPAPIATQTDRPGTTAVTPGTTVSEQQGQSTSAQERQTDPAVSESAGTDEDGTTAQGYSEPEKSSRGSSFNGDSLASSMPLMIGIVVLALLVLGLIIFAASRKLGSSPNRVMAQVASSSSSPKTVLKDDMVPFVDHSKELSSYAASQNKQRTTPYTNRPVKPDINKPIVINPSGPLLLNLFVEDQNTAIGKRNIHSLKSGYSLSVGGGKSDYLIFLVPIPANIGEIRRSGSQCSFIPRKPKYFPDLGSNELRDCINKTIRIVSDKNYEIRFRFEMYEDPLIALNRTLMSIKVPG
jgi:hypothetical protein